MSYYYSRVFNKFQPSSLDISGSIVALHKSFLKTNLLICGESHGVRENADVVYTLAKILGAKQLAIERSTSIYSDFVQSALAGSPNFLLPQVMPSLQASVLSLEMLKTITVLINENIIKNIAYVDLDSKNNQSLKNISTEKYMKIRETAIADNILQLNMELPTMVILGSYHTRQYADDVVGTSSLQIVRQSRDATYLLYNYLQGNQYNGGRLMQILPNNQLNEFKHTGEYWIDRQKNDNFIINIPKAHRILV